MYLDYSCLPPVMPKLIAHEFNHGYSLLYIIAAQNELTVILLFNK